MGIDAVSIGTQASLWHLVESLVAADGSASHRALIGLGAADAPGRDVADAIHMICLLHGSHPGILDRAAGHDDHPGAARWLRDSAAAFAGERMALARLVAIAGPLPSTPGQAETEAAVMAQRHALDMLGQSDRVGCALGAAVALALDWAAIGRFLDHAALGLGAQPEPRGFPDLVATRRIVGAVAGSPAVQRALMFGVQQVLAQHRGLWDLIEARALARRHD